METADILLNGVGAFVYEDKILLYCKAADPKRKTFHVTVSQDGLHYYFFDDTAIVTTRSGRLEDIQRCADFRIVSIESGYVALYTKKTPTTTHLCSALSHDAIHWEKIGRIASLAEPSVIVSNFTYNGQYVLYTGGTSLRAGFSPDLKKWKVTKNPIITSKGSIVVGWAEAQEDGILLVYVERNTEGGTTYHSLNAHLFSRNDPVKPLWNSPRVVWSQPEEWKNRKLRPVGIVKHNELFIAYWQDDSGAIIALTHPIASFQKGAKTSSFNSIVSKWQHNPVLSPVGDHAWESQAVFNAAALYDEGKVHLVYRAVGDSGVSVLGYAASNDGLHFDIRHPEPVFYPMRPFDSKNTTGRWLVHSKRIISGGISGGCEDPRMTRIGDRIYLIYVAFDGWSPQRLALTSIAANDFFKREWNWDMPKLISPPGVVNKSGCILPEKIQGKYMIFHRVYPNILIDFVDNLDFDDNTWLKGEYAIPPRSNCWDSRKVGFGPPPLKTDAGWLAIYHAVDDRDDSRYKIGAMLLDTNDPTKVIARSTTPIIEPTEHYENGGLKYGVVYPCGSVIMNNQLIVYYGGSDTVVCAATAPLPVFLDALKNEASSQLQPVSLVHRPSLSN
ncbi:hypothetical protein HY468_04930 [Candidatus Roizmanbacteria bacterium]|nr:hypothetical protein [Candidatus Roizmanbacteria bacterium]